MISSSIVNEHIDRQDKVRLQSVYKDEPFIWGQSPQHILNSMQARLDQVLIGKQSFNKQVVSCLLAGGHLLIEDRPGVGKTMLATAIARLLGGQFNRIQFTSDMLPADIIGGMVLQPATQQLMFRQGPIMANIVLADELNRTSPRTQSALLEVLEDGAVSVEGERHVLPSPFLFIATQNPIHYEGTNRLPEAQLDRFMMQLSIGYPAKQDEMELIKQFATGARQRVTELRPIVTDMEWLQMQRELQTVFVHDTLIEYMAAVAERTRQTAELSLGLSPRAMRDWLRAGQAYAYMEGRGYLLPDDLFLQAEAVLLHRLKWEQSKTLSGIDANAWLSQLLRDIPMTSTESSQVRRNGK